MAKEKDVTQNLMEYLTLHLRETNNIQLPACLRGLLLNSSMGFSED